MNNRDIIGLINKELDGTLLPGESATLQRILETNEEARIIRADLRRLGKTLASVEQAASPPSLLPGVMRRIEEREAHSTRKVRRPFHLFETLRGRALSTGIGFAGGIAFGILGFFLASNLSTLTDIHDAEVSGTLTGSTQTPAITGVQSTPFNADGVTGTLRTQTSTNVITVGLEMHSPDTCAARLIFDPTRGSIEAVRPSGEFSGTISMANGMLLVHGGNSLALEITLRRHAPGRLTLQTDITRRETGIASRTISLE